MQAHQLSATKKGIRRIGRGGKRGSFSGRGIKGQSSRAGHRIRPQVRDIIKKLHKRRGYGRNRGRSVVPTKTLPQIINISDLNKIFTGGEHITSAKLIANGLIKKGQSTKILGGGKAVKKFTFEKGLQLSSSLSKKFSTEQ